MLVIFTVPPLTSGAPDKDKDKGQEFTQVYQHTYDEVFQATQVAIERSGYFVTDKDKDKGTISGNGYLIGHFTFDIHIEALNTKPETRVAIIVVPKGRMAGSAKQAAPQRILVTIQKVLATYQ
jgi:hypothetical protein